jgi:hypothetical protein
MDDLIVQNVRKGVRDISRSDVGLFSRFYTFYIV